MMFLLGVYLKRLTAPPLIKVTLSLNLVWQSLMHCGMPSEDRVTSKSNYFLDGYKKKKNHFIVEADCMDSETISGSAHPFKGRQWD